jgi:GTP-binding protein LepA
MLDRIRNFSIIAHIDHGKSTLADRLLEITQTVNTREMKAQFMDSMDLERERGITIKLNTARMYYKAHSGKDYILNLIDTPGHVDFTYEVSRSLSACEGVLLVVDASQGIEAQTLANVYLALDHGLEIIPVINKIDLPGANVKKVQEELYQIIGIKPEECYQISAKTGMGVPDVLEAIVNLIPAPKGKTEDRLQALIFDSYFDAYRGVVVKICLKNGVLKKKDEILTMETDKQFEVLELGYFRSKMEPVEQLSAGEVGYLISNIKEVADARVGDTITLKKYPAATSLPGFKTVLPMVYCGLFPVDADDFPSFKVALGKLQLSDASLAFEPENSKALGFGFRCGFLGLLHMEIVQERLEREYNLDLVITAPSVVYRINLRNKDVLMIESPSKLPDLTLVESMEEPVANVTIITPNEYVGGVMELSQGRRGEFVSMDYLDVTRVMLKYKMPIAEIITDFFNNLKAKTQGYASLDYEMAGYQKADLVKLDVMLNGEPVDALSVMLHRANAYGLGRKLCEKLKEIIPPHQFVVAIQASIGGKVIARETVSALRKDVLAKCYGGDVSRKRKLLEKQKEGKKRMKSVGSVDLPQKAFMAVLGLNQD